MKNIKYILLVSACYFLPNEGIAEINLTFDVANFSSSNTTLHTHHTPVELKPISNFVKLAAVCSIIDGGCSGNMGFNNSGDNNIDFNPSKLCSDDGYLITSCPVNQVGQDFCSYNDDYFKSCKCNAEFQYTSGSCQSQFPNSDLGSEQCSSDGITYSNSCVCNATTYPYTSSNCPAPQNLSGTSCVDKSTTHYIQCICPSTKDCDLGCKTYHASPCDYSCKECKTCSPAPVPEGYTAYDKSCENDEVKKTFDDGCENKYYKCEKSCVPEIGHVYYADGTCSATNDTTKQAIGLVYWVFDNGKKNTFNVMALDEPSIMNWSESINYCKSYSKHGIKGWKLPEISELIPMGLERPFGVGNDKFKLLERKLASIVGAKQFGDVLYWSTSDSYSYVTNTWGINPLGEFLYPLYKDYDYSVRCILAF